MRIGKWVLGLVAYANTDTQFSTHTKPQTLYFHCGPLKATSHLALVLIPSHVSSQDYSYHHQLHPQHLPHHHYPQ